MAYYYRCILRPLSSRKGSPRTSVPGLQSTFGRLYAGSAASFRQHHCNAGSPPSEPTPLEARGPYAARLKSRGVLRFEGPDTLRFLQGLVTNDVNRLAQEPPPPMASEPTPNQPVAFTPPLYTALLNPQGRFLFDLFLYRPVRPAEKLDGSGSGPGSDGAPVLFGDADASALDELLIHLKKYRLRARVEIEDISRDMSVWQCFGGPLVQKDEVNEHVEGMSIGWGASTDPSPQAAVEGDEKGNRWFKDPRLGLLGLRGIFPPDTVPPLVEADKEVDEAYYVLWRLQHGVAEGCTEIPKGKANPLEYNLARLNAISFEKGCYVGQELVARTHHRGVIRKRLMPLVFVHKTGEEAQQAVAPGAEVIDASSKKKVGDVTTVLGPRGLGLIRLEAMQKDPSHLLVKDTEGIHVNVYRPNWWPSDWGQEEVQQAESA